MIYLLIVSSTSLASHYVRSINVNCQLQICLIFLSRRDAAKLKFTFDDPLKKARMQVRAARFAGELGSAKPKNKINLITINDDMNAVRIDYLLVVLIVVIQVVLCYNSIAYFIWS